MHPFLWPGVFTSALSDTQPLFLSSNLLTQLGTHLLCFFDRNLLYGQAACACENNSTNYRYVACVTGRFVAASTARQTRRHTVLSTIFLLQYLSSFRTAVLLRTGLLAYCFLHTTSSNCFLRRNPLSSKAKKSLYT